MRTLSLILLAALLAPPAFASSDHERVRAAVEAGDILPLRTILERAEAAHPGQLIEAELEDEDGRLIYELKLITPDGRVVELEYDARSGELLKVKGKRRR